MALIVHKKYLCDFNNANVRQHEAGYEIYPSQSSDLEADSKHGCKKRGY